MMKHNIIISIQKILYWLIGFLNWYNGILYQWDKNRWGSFVSISKSTRWGVNKNYKGLWI